MDACDLKNLDKLLRRADRVCRMDELWNLSAPRPTDIFMRHDVDGNPGSWENSLAMARWEHERGFRSTYYFLHATYFWNPGMSDGLHEIAALGHEIGFHNNALAIARRLNTDPFDVLERALAELREWSGEEVISTAAHGDKDCSYGGFINYQLFVESLDSSHVRDCYKHVEELGIVPRPLADFGFKFQGDWLARPHYVTDSGGTWAGYADPANYPYVATLEQAVKAFPWDDGHLVILQHPDWWRVALYPELQAA